MEELEALLHKFPRSEWEHVLNVVTADFDVVEAVHDNAHKTFYTKRVIEPSIEILLPDYRHLPDLLAEVSAARDHFRHEAAVHGQAHLRRQQALVRVWTVGGPGPEDPPPAERTTQLPDIYPMRERSPVRGDRQRSTSLSPTQTLGRTSTSAGSRRFSNTTSRLEAADGVSVSKSPVLAKVNERLRMATR